MTVPRIRVHRANVCSADAARSSADGFGCSAERSICFFDGFRSSVRALFRSTDGLICPVGGFLCSTDGFIYSVEARNWWIEATSSMDAVNLASRGVLKTYAEAAICCIGAKLTAAGPETCSFLPNFVADSAPRRSNGARNIVARANKTISRANKTVGVVERCSVLGRIASVPLPERSSFAIVRRGTMCRSWLGPTALGAPITAVFVAVRSSTAVPQHSLGPAPGGGLLRRS